MSRIGLDGLLGMERVVDVLFQQVELVFLVGLRLSNILSLSVLSLDMFKLVLIIVDLNIQMVIKQAVMICFV